MATYCPKCNYKLRVRDYKPECPQCGINLVYYGMEERLRAEADAAELEYAKSKPKYDRLKAATVGNTISKVRLGIYILPVLSLLLPLGSYSLILPFFEKSVTINIISIVQLIMDFDFGLLIKMMGSGLFGTQFILLGVSIVSILLVIVVWLVQFVMVMLSCSPKGLIRNFILGALGIVFAVVSAVTYNMAASQFSEFFPSITTMSLGWGIVGVVLAFCACIGVNAVHKVKGIEVKYTDVSEYFMPYEERPSTIAARAAQAARAAETTKKEAVAAAPAE